MKFRKLSLEELELLKEDFIKFLASNTITAEDWVKMKIENIEKAESLIEMFSEIVMEKVYSKIEYLENRTKDSILLFKFEGDLMQILGVNTPDPAIDFTHLDLTKIDLEKIKLTGFRSSKVLEKGMKSLEVHQLIENDCYMCDASRFKLLDEIIE